MFGVSLTGNGRRSLVPMPNRFRSQSVGWRQPVKVILRFDQTGLTLLRDDRAFLTLNHSSASSPGEEAGYMAR